MAANPRANGNSIGEESVTKHYERVVMKKLGQGAEERLHPGTPTFGHTQESLQEQANQHQANPAGESAAVEGKPELKEPSSGMQ
jgi:hypothetical protein